MATEDAQLREGRLKDTAEVADGETPQGKRSSSRDPIAHPGTVLINVQGAFIVDDSPPTPTASPGAPQEEFLHHTQDIRLPNHTAIVSHMAVDVSQ